MWHEWTSHLAHLGPNGGMGEGEKKERKEKGREKESLRERDFTFSLCFPVIGPTVSGGARGKVYPCS